MVNSVVIRRKSVESTTAQTTVSGWDNVIKQEETKRHVYLNDQAAISAQRMSILLKINGPGTAHADRVILL